MACKQQKFISHISEPEKSKIIGARDLVSSESLPLVHRHLLLLQPHSGKGEGTLSGVFHKALILRAEPYDLITSQTLSASKRHHIAVYDFKVRILEGRKCSVYRAEPSSLTFSLKFYCDATRVCLCY